MTLKRGPWAGVIMLGVALAGCDQTSHSGPTVASAGAGICTPFKGVDAAVGAPASAAPPDGSAAVEECLHRWGYALAASKEVADVVAAATVTACNGPIVSWNQQALSQTAGQESEEATSLRTGETASPVAEHIQLAQSQALFYVVQARAGKCAPPPDKLLVRGG